MDCTEKKNEPIISEKEKTKTKTKNSEEEKKNEESWDKTQWLTGC